MCTIAAPALAASIADWAIWDGVTGTAGFLPGVSADPVTAHEIITLRCIRDPQRLCGRHLSRRRRARPVREPEKQQAPPAPQIRRCICSGEGT